MRTSKQIMANYDRVSRKLFTDAFELEIADRNDSCIFCGEQGSKQSVYYPPKAEASKVLVDGKRGVVGYCCIKHYVRFRNMSAQSALGLTFEDFYSKISRFGERRSSTGAPVFDRPLPNFRMAVDGQVWYVGLGHMNFIRIDLPVYESFKELVAETGIRHIGVDGRRAMFTDWRASNEVSDRELMALEHFLKL